MTVRGRLLLKKLGRIPDGGWPKSTTTEGTTTTTTTLIRAAEFFAQNGIPRIERIISDNALAYRKSLKEASALLGAEQRFIKPHYPRTNGESRTPQPELTTEWAYRLDVHQQPGPARRACSLLNCYSAERIHTGIGATPIIRVSPTS